MTSLNDFKWYHVMKLWYGSSSLHGRHPPVNVSHRTSSTDKIHAIQLATLKVLYTHKVKICPYPPLHVHEAALAGGVR